MRPVHENILHGSVDLSARQSTWLQSGRKRVRITHGTSRFKEREGVKRMPKITPFLWFDNQAEEAANFYVSIFPNSKVVKTVRYGEAGPLPKGTVMTVVFQLDGQQYVALNGGPQFKFTEATSFSVDCKTQKEIDEYWKKLTEGGEEQPCGWLKDKYGLSWQVNSTILGEMLGDPDPKKARRVMEAMLQMKKIDLEALKKL
jgi:predicted 3-demethylubiquinone-9 3-methyltransferase (glyoxalase superfamily)